MSVTRESFGFMPDGTEIYKYIIENACGTQAHVLTLGATLQSFIINGKKQLNGDCEVETYHDHRLAMSMYIAGLISQRTIQVNDFQWVEISFPEFEKLITSLQ